jgi:transcriptional regulator with XRE-family HTH domain
MNAISQIVTASARANYHSLCGDEFDQTWQSVTMDKNGGPNYLRAWREFREMTQQELAEAVGTNSNMIGYLESGERGLSAKWLRRLAPALNTTSGMILDHDPAELDSDIIEIWAHANTTERQQLADVAKAVVKRRA